jgi:sarcosine oxidase
MTYDVIGVGGMGSAAVYHLARRGASVLGLERFEVPHDLGSSHGVNRIIRLAYFEHPSYVPLLRRAYELWRELEHEHGVQLLHVTGSIDAGRPGSRTFEGSRHSCEVHSLPHEILTSAQLSRRFPGFQLPSELVAVLQPDGGFLVPERCIVAQSTLAALHGAEVNSDERVIAWETTWTGVRVTTERATYDAGQLVVTAGSWTKALIPSLSPLLSPERQVLAWFDMADHGLFAPSRFPVFNLDFDDHHWYGFPEHGTPGFKIGCYHHLREQVEPDALDRSVVTEHDLSLLRDLVRRCFPAADGNPLLTKVCLFTNTPDEHFILDRLPEAPEVVVASACSGHGFKFCSVVGEIVADLVERDATEHDIGLHRLSRFADW